MKRSDAGTAPVSPPPAADASVPATDLVAIDYDRLRQVSSVVQFANVAVVEMAYRTLSFKRDADPPVRRAARFDCNVVDARWHLVGATFHVGLGYQVDTEIKTETGPSPLFRLTARWILTYALPENFRVPDPADEIMADFVAANAQVNVFPYLRELVTDLSAKAGWLPLVLPVFRAPAKRHRDLVRRTDVWAPLALPTDQSSST